MFILISENITNLEFIGYHCSSKDNLEDTSFYAEIEANYVHRFYRTIVTLLKSHDLYGVYLDYLQEYEKEFGFSFDEEEYIYSNEEEVEKLSEELSVIFFELGVSVIFVSNQKLTEYGNECYEVYMQNNKYEWADDPNERAAFVYFYIKEENKPILKKIKNG